MPKLLNTLTKSIEEVSPDDILPKLSSGSHDLVKGEAYNVINPQGDIVSLPAESVFEAVNQYGFKMPTQQDIANLEQYKQYGQGTANEVKAFLAGAGRSATFGLSDQALVKSGEVNPETLKGLQEQNPTASTLGEFTGIGASLLAVPEISLVGKASKGAQALTKAAEPATAAAARLLANPATRPLASKVLDTAGKLGAISIGSAIEGAAYGLGQSVSEQALGDPELTGEKVLSNMENGALVGAALGPALGLVGMGAKKAFPKFFTEADKVALEKGDFETAVKVDDYIPAEEKKSVIEGLSKLKGNAKEIKEAALAIDAPVLPGQISDSKAVQKAQSALLEGPPTFSSIKQQMIAQEGFEKASKAVGETLGEGTQFTKASLGEELKSSLESNIKRQVEPINAIYDEIKTKFESVPLKEKSVNAISRNILKLDEVRISKSSPESVFARTLAEDIKNLKNVDDVKLRKSALNREAAGRPELKHIAGVLSDKLSNLEENTIVDFAKKQMKTKLAKGKVLELLDMREAANAEYTVFRDKIDRLGEVIGKRKIYGAQDFLNFLEDMTPEKVSQKLFAKGNSKFLEFFSKEFPQEMKNIADYQKGFIKEAAIKDGKLDVRKVLKEVYKLEPEIRDVLFSKDELKKIANVKTYIESMPPNFNPSNTNNADAFRSFFESPIKAMTGSVRDAAISKFIRFATDAGKDDMSVTISSLAKIERAAQKTTNQIYKNIEKIVKSRVIEVEPVYFETKELNKEEKQKKFKKAIDKVTQLYNNPTKLIDDLTAHTEDLHAVAPNTSQSVVNAATRATAFLYEKMPQKPESSILSSDYHYPMSDIDTYNHYVSVIEKPVSVLSEIAQGRLSTKSVEVMNRVYPSLYAHMKQEILHSLTEQMHKKDFYIPYPVKMSLSLFMGQDLDASMKSQNIASNQISLANKKQQNQIPSRNIASQNTKGVGKITLSDRMKTDVQKSAQRK